MTWVTLQGPGTCLPRDSVRPIACTPWSCEDTEEPTVRPAAEYRFEDVYSDISVFATEIGLEGAVVIGHGAGSRLAARLAADLPNAVSSLAVCDLEAREDHAESEWASFDEMVGYLKRQRPGAADSVLDRQGRSLSGGGLDGGRSFKHDSAAYPAYMASADRAMGRLESHRLSDAGAERAAQPGPDTW